MNNFWNGEKFSNFIKFSFFLKKCKRFISWWKLLIFIQNVDLDELAQLNEKLLERSRGRRADYKLVDSEIIKTAPEPVTPNLKVPTCSSLLSFLYSSVLVFAHLSCPAKFDEANFYHLFSNVDDLFWNLGCYFVFFSTAAERSFFPCSS